MELQATQSSLQAFYFHPPFTQNHWSEILDEIYVKRVYQRFITGKKDLLIVDVGANVGLTAYYFKDYAKQVFALEPSQQHFDALRTMLKTNNITNITPLQYAISNKNGKETFYHNANQTAFSLSKDMSDQEGNEVVDTLTMDTFMHDYKIDSIDILKLDPEGEEAKIIQSEGFKKVAPKIKTILGEYHVWSGVSKDNFRVGLEELGYEFHWRHDTQASVYEAVRV